MSTAGDPSAEPANPLRHPARAVAMVGLLGVAVGVFGPWVQGVIADGSTVALNGFSGAADGAFQLVLCGALVVLLRSRAAGESHTLAVQLLPAAVGVVCLAYALIAARTLDELMLLLSEQGAEPVVGWGLQLDVASSIVTAGAAMATTAAVMRAHPRRRREAADAPVVDRRTVTAVAVVITGILLGAGAGLVAALVVLRSTENGAVVFFVGGGALVGWLIGDTVRRMAREWGSIDQR